ncbi:MAG: phosphoglucosamine mutase [Lutibacter sp.]|uniref:phosphoglucosamine mutase n=1 Tax=Lutibacter sp. TaxID=1925666 RepID=UPI00299EE9EE|nr:phosphoglucosamine mutase [Lutibacter sp.]MDX1830150.1 phosphoglucosamine mutase [Lutibacter sp.]
MTLIKSISGIRGTIGGKVGENLTPLDAVKFAAAYGMWLKNNTSKKDVSVILGRDARISGKLVSGLVGNTLISLGIKVIDIGLSTTPTVEVAVQLDEADGGIIITASHNPKQWNALKLLNNKGEFLNAAAGEEVLKIAENESFEFVEVDDLGVFRKKQHYINRHISEVLKLNLVDVEAIKSAKFKVVVDAVNSTGGIAIPALLEKLGVECVELYCEPNGEFPHNPEPLKEHLTDISELVVKEKADLGIVVDPDVDRLALICEDGTMFGEEYTLVACADYVLGKTKGNTVSNLSSSRALKDVTEKHGGNYMASAVGEVNVVEQMKATKAVIGGEGNGGIIYPESHYGRDSLVGVALFLSHLAQSKISCKALRNTYPDYFMSKNKIQLTPDVNVDDVLAKMTLKYKNEDVITIDGVKINFEKEWVHLRKSNTEPIIRIYTESTSQNNADELAERFIKEIKSIIIN